MRIAFLFNHDQVHQVAHSLPIAIELAAEALDTEVIIAVTNDRLRAEVVRLAGGAIGRNLHLVRLDLRTRLSRLTARVAECALPATKLLVYGDNLDFFRSLDMLVVAEKTSLILKTRYGLDRLKIVHTRHGAGDRAIGFDKASARFDHVLVSGVKIRDRLIAGAGLSPDRVTIVGYPKFDVSFAPPRLHPLLDDGRPVVLYNPHVSPHLSSWFKLGRKILDWFVEHDEYHLIFAPHVMLFERPFVLTIDRLRIDRPGRINERYLRAPNIHIDLGSRASTTMAYTDCADVYIGDVSSQVYEFMRTPRPCLFVDAHATDWQGDPNYLHWCAGPVVADLQDLEAKLATASATHATTYRAEQQRLFASSFDLTAEPSSRRAARVVAQVAGLSLPEAAPIAAYA